MAIVNPPGWIQALSTHTAAQLRMYTASMLAGTSTSATVLRARGGVHPGFGSELAVTQAGSPNMSVLVESGACSIPGTESSTQGNYFAVNDAQVTLSISAAHATLARIDIVVVNVRDAQYSGANNDVQLQVVTGTPASSPVAPSAPANSITIAQVAVGAAVSSIVNANITDTRDYVAAVGGLINTRNIAAAPTSAQITEGQFIWSNSGDTLHIWDGSAYNQIYPGYNKISENILGGTATTVTFSSIPTKFRHLRAVVMARGDAAAQQFVTVSMRFNNDSGANYDNLQLYGSGSGSGAIEALNGTGIIIGDMPGPTTVSGSVAYFTIDIPWYNDSTFWQGSISQKTLMSQTSGGQANQLWRKSRAGRWRNTAAVTRLDFVSASGNFIAGSSFAVYGVV